MTPLTGTYGGEDYEITPFKGGWFVEREGGGRYAVQLNPASCDCGDFIWKRDGLTPVPCKHVRAARHILKERF